MTETELEDALRARVAAAVAPTVSDAKVIWDRQRGQRPAAPFVELRLVGPAGYSGAAPDWQHEYDPDVAHGGTSAVDGGEVVEKTINHHDYELRVQTYAADQRSARSVMLLIHDAFYQRSTRDALRAAGGIAVADVGALQDVGALLQTDWEGRAVMSIQIRVADMLTERTGYVATVETLNQITQ
jgi:hypothetical protein